MGEDPRQYRDERQKLYKTKGARWGESATIHSGKAPAIPNRVVRGDWVGDNTKRKQREAIQNVGDQREEGPRQYRKEGQKLLYLAGKSGRQYGVHILSF